MTAEPVKKEKTAPAVKKIRQTPDVLGFTVIKLVPGFKGKARMVKRPYPTRGAP